MVCCFPLHSIDGIPRSNFISWLLSSKGVHEQLPSGRLYPSPFASLLLCPSWFASPSFRFLCLWCNLSASGCAPHDSYTWEITPRRHQQQQQHQPQQPHPQSGHLGSCSWNWSWGHNPEILTRQKQSRPRTRSKWIMAAGVIINERSPLELKWKCTKKNLELYEKRCELNWEEFIQIYFLYF